MQIHMHQDGIKHRKLLVALVVGFLGFQCVSTLSLIPTSKAGIPTTLYVGEGEQYQHIQDAINNASEGYRIFVYNGTYYENLTINRRIDLFGEDRSITIIDGNETDTVITVNAAHVNISHFTITNGGTTSNDSIIQINQASAIITDNIISEGYYGIFLNSCGNHLIYDNIIMSNTGDGIRLNNSDLNINISFNTITGNRNGILLYSSDNNHIFDNTIQENDNNGLFLNKTSQSNAITDNNCSYNNHSGIYVNDYSDHSVLSSNQVYENNQSGIALENCSWAIISEGNDVIKNVIYGIMIVGSNNIIQDNTLLYNNKDGMYLSADNDNTISNNLIGYNTRTGIRLYNSTADEIYSNEIYNNEEYGAYLDFFTIRNYFYNNFFHDNTKNALDKSLGTNHWNIGITPGTNIVGGDNISGNYWDDYDEPSEGAFDNDRNDIADTPYTIYTVNKDNGPLLDVDPPVLGDPSESPHSQTLGQYTSFSITVTDNLELRDITVNVTNPHGNHSYFSILGNKTGDTYTGGKRFSPIGNYTYYIAARDARNWNQSTEGNFSIHQGEPPTITDNSPKTGSPSSIFSFNVTVTAGETTPSDLRVYVNWKHASKSGNYSMVNTFRDFFVKNVTLDHSVDNLTYYIFAADEWGNQKATETVIVKIIDSHAPTILVDQHGPTFKDLPNSYTFSATVIDDCAVADVSIEYWYNGSTKMTTDMDYITTNYFRKVIVPQGTPDRVYCVIYANDTAGNINHTKNPHASPGGPYTGVVLERIRFNGTGCYDLDGNITRYLWNFGDGTTGDNSTPTHTYLSSGYYTATLTVTDNDGRQGNSSARVHILSLTPHWIPQSKLTWINQRYNLSLSEQFYCYDSDGDGINDSFLDPNDVITAVHNELVIINNGYCFLLSIGDDLIPEFFWDTTTDDIIPITHTVGIVNTIEVDTDTEQATMNITVDKATWIYIDVDDPYPNSTVTTTTVDKTISSDLIWRIGGKIYVLDDPEQEYLFVFDHIFPALEAVIHPEEGGVIEENNPTITITYNVPVEIVYVSFGDLIIDPDELLTSDDIAFTYTPPGDLENGTYPFEIHAQALQGSGYLSSSTMFFFFRYIFPPEKSFLEKNALWIFFIGLVIGLVALVLFLKVKHITVDGFIYIKNRKTIPFFKPIVLGPMSVRIKEQGLSKAEFYVDGKLKDTIDSTPCVWQWNEKALMKHTLETKVYDETGRSASSGAMEFYIFNPITMKEKE